METVKSSTTQVDWRTSAQLPWLVQMRTLTLVWLALLVYGSLIPFDLSWGALTELGLWGLATSPQWRLPSMGESSSQGVSKLASDLATNLVLYLPLGLFAARWFKRQWGMAWLAMILVVLTSWTLECLQGLSPSRSASSVDILTNSISGFVGVLLAGLIVGGFRQTVFRTYTQLINPWRDLREAMAQRRGLQVLIGLLAVVGVVLLLVTYRTVGGDPVGVGSSGETVNYMPFADHFKRSYDVAAVFLGRSMLFYTLAACLLSLIVLRQPRHARWKWAVLLMAGVSFGFEMLDRVQGQARADITEPILAVSAVVMLFSGLAMAGYAIRTASRRRQQQDYDGPERRRREHVYS